MDTVVEVSAERAKDYMRKNTEFPFSFLELFLQARLLVCRSFQSYSLERILFFFFLSFGYNTITK